ncbi:TetR/AcrR family transcriptional regulator [Actinocorallia libanotica]|uniref:TetR/AcrR family transcriptional regulator n=1 Tax=Actinocorallia libanotica TaxID=46162 RepID=A0ABP4C4J7_9ACTN
MGARERILDAAAALVARSGFEAVNMVAVAREAGVSRQTVYAHFGGRDELLSEAMVRVTHQVLGRLDARIADVPDAAEYVVELIVAVRAECRRHPVLGALLLADRGSPLFDEETFVRTKPAAERLLVPLLVREPRLAARFGDVVEVILRSALSVLLFDSDAVRTDEDLRSFLRWTLLPVLESAYTRG